MDQQLKAYALENDKDYVSSDVHYKNGEFLYGIRYRGEVGDFDNFKINPDFVYNDKDYHYLDEGSEDRETLLEEIGYFTKTNAPGSDDFTVMSFAVKDKDYGNRVVKNIKNILEPQGIELKFIAVDKTVNDAYMFDLLCDDSDVQSKLIAEQEEK